MVFCGVFRKFFLDLADFFLGTNEESNSDVTNANERYSQQTSVVQASTSYGAANVNIQNGDFNKITEDLSVPPVEDIEHELLPEPGPIYATVKKKITVENISLDGDNLISVEEFVEASSPAERLEEIVQSEQPDGEHTERGTSNPFVVELIDSMVPKDVVDLAETSFIKSTNGEIKIQEEQSLTLHSLPTKPEPNNDIDNEQREETPEENVSGHTITEDVQILDVQQYFEDLHQDAEVPKDSIEYITQIRDKAEGFETRVNNYSGTNYSVDYFVIDESLMRLLEELDKVKCHNNVHMLEEKIKTIDYINTLHSNLDSVADDN